MKKSFLFFILSLLVSISFAQNNWKIVPGRISSPWAEKVNPSRVLPDYPRPQLQRKEWTSLNGLWQYSIVPAPGGDHVPASYDGQILVPFAVESALSGVGRTVGKDSVLWYKTEINVEPKRNNKKILLHFGAVDWRADVFVNGTKAGTQEGGYDPFTFDITSQLKKGAKQQIAVRVWDPTDDGPQPRGKQVKQPRGIWYTSVTGIWQTVWLETLPDTYIAATKQTPDLDAQSLHIVTSVANLQPQDQILVSAWKGTEKIAEKAGVDTSITLSIPHPEQWSPEHPFLYDLKVAIIRRGKQVDEVKSYFAMRKISIAPDNNGVQRMMLNNRFVFELGPLDQGWWPDGLYTAPTDEALKFDIEKTKEMGFNMIRKHVKVEPARWYYYCDQLGMLVWQDMPSGDLGNRWDSRPGIIGRASDKDRTPESEKIYRAEWNEIVSDLYNFPCIVVWTPFNEGWGQFKTTEIGRWTMQKDPSRVVNSASGGNFEPVGHILDLHNYPEPAMPDAQLFGTRKAVVLGEFGGLGLPLENHTWQGKNNWGYQTFKDRDELLKRYTEFIDRFPALIQKGLSAAVYTQITDVEVETNGLMTYDRKEMKMPVASLKAAHEKLFRVELAKK